MLLLIAIAHSYWHYNFFCILTFCKRSRNIVRNIFVGSCKSRCRPRL